MALSDGLLLDTHAWIWLRFGTLTARPEVMDAIRKASEQEAWYFGCFSFYEIGHAVNRKRLLLDVPVQDWLQGASDYGQPEILSITPEIAAAATSLPDNFHGDPGDRIIAATAIVYNLTICTHDKALLRYAKDGLFRALKVSELREKPVIEGKNVR